MKNYGKELILDIHKCKVDRFTKEQLKEYFIQLCNLIEMERQKLHFWEYEDQEEYKTAPPHLKGISAIQFISTSNITIHTLDDLKCVYINIFSCKDFCTDEARNFTEKFFKGIIVNENIIGRV